MLYSVNCNVLPIRMQHHEIPIKFLHSQKEMENAIVARTCNRRTQFEKFQ